MTGSGRRLNALAFRLMEGVGVKVQTALSFRLALFDGNAMHVRIRIMTNAGHLPGNLDVGRTGLHREAISLDFLRDHGLGKGADDGELVTKVLIQGFKPIRQNDGGVALGIRRGGAVIDVHHVRRFHERMREVLVLRVERVVDLERAAAFCQVAPDGNVATNKQVAVSVNVAGKLSCRTSERSIESRSRTYDDSSAGEMARAVSGAAFNLKACAAVATRSLATSN